MFETLSVAYAAEVMPVVLRGYFLSYINLCCILGQICAVGVIRALVGVDSKWAYRLPFTLQWAFLVATLSGVVFAPESPCGLSTMPSPTSSVSN
jgi:SP family general alpha glucoside:H+ symporter-like MFS transporter